MTDWIEKEVPIKEVKQLLKNNIVEVNSPDGWVAVKQYVEKGKKQSWKLKIDDKEILSSSKHLFETNSGWVSTNKLDNKKHKILCQDGKFKSFDVKLTDQIINVVDIAVDNNNHRYYTNGVSSHNTNLGKSLIMTSIGVECLLQNKNVLYVTCEMAEEKIAERVMANMFDVDIGVLNTIPRDKFMDKFEVFDKKIPEQFYVKEYAPRSISVNHIRVLLKELEAKRKFVPDIIFIDYLGIMMSTISRKSDNTYVELKRISEEVRALAVEFGVPIVSAIQSNRAAIGSAEIDLKNVADSIGSAATADIIVGVTQSEELREQGKYAWVFLKNRYGINKQKILINVNYNKMRISEDLDAPVVNMAEVEENKTQAQKQHKLNAAAGIVNKVLNKDDEDKFKSLIGLE